MRVLVRFERMQINERFDWIIPFSSRPEIGSRLLASELVVSPRRGIYKKTDR